MSAKVNRVLWGMLLVSCAQLTAWGSCTPALQEPCPVQDLPCTPALRIDLLTPQDSAPLKTVAIS